jgi:hypothetical protein
MEQELSYRKTSKMWWRQRRWSYNKGLVIAGISAFILYVILASCLIAPHDTDFEITLFTTLFQGIGYLFMMGVANVLYNLGYLVDSRFNTGNNESFRLRLYKMGYWFSFSLPFLIPLLIVIEYFVVYAKH